ncbi:MAG: helix-turn-helix domain-containing protein [Novosphingobium sp.]
MTGAAVSRETRVRGFLATEKAERTRAIVAAAYELIDEGGLEDLTIRAVLKRTGLARRAFYEQFAGKDDLVLAVFEQAMRFAATMFGELVAPIADPVERLKTIILSIGHGAVSPEDVATGAGQRMAAALSREHLRLAEARPDELHHALRPLMALIADQLAAGMASGQVRQADPERLTLFIYNLVATTLHTELITQETAGPASERRDRLADELWDFCRRAIAA